LSNFARVIHHIDMKDVKRKRLKEIAAKKLEEERDKKEKELIQEILKKYKSDWRREIDEGMTTSAVFSTTIAPAEGDGTVTQLTPSDATSFSDTTNMFGADGNNSALDGTTIRANGSGSGNTGGFDVGGDYLAFQGTGSGGSRMALLKPMDATRLDTLTITAIRGTGSNGGEHPDIVGTEELFVIYKTPDMSRSSYLSQDRSQNNVGSFPADAAIISINQGDGTLQDYTIKIPEYARQKDTIFGLFQLGHSGSNYDHYGVTDIKFQRKTPLNVVVPLDDPQAVSFIRVGTDEGDPKKRKKKLNDQLAASDEYTTNITGAPFPGAGTRVGGEDPYRSASLTPDDEIEASPIGKGEVKKSFSSFSADAATAEPESEEELFIPASSQTTIKPKDEDGNEIPVKPVGRIAVQGADAANLDAQNAQDDTQNTTTTFDPATSDPEEPELDPEETEKEAELSDDEKEELKNQGKSEEEIKREENLKKEQAKLDKLTDELIKRNDYIAHDVAGINEILSNVTWLIGAFNDYINPITWGMKALGLYDHSGKLVNNLNIARSVFSGKVENHIPNHREIKEFTDSLIPFIFDDETHPYYVPISDERHPYADKNIKVDAKGKVSINDGTHQDLADKSYAALGDHGKGYAQLIIPKDGGRPYVHYYDYNYHNLNSPDEGEVPNFEQEILSALTHLLGEMGAVKSLLTIPFVGALKKAIFNYEQVFESLKNKSGLEGWPPGIHGAALTDFKVDIKNLPKETQEMIAMHPLSWTDERVANMSDDYLYEQMNLLLDREEIIYQESDDGKSFLDKIGKILKSREANVDPKFAKAFIDINDQYFERLEKYDELQEIYKKPEASLAETKSREDWRALQEEQKEATTREELHKKFSKGIKIPNPKTDGDKSPDYSEWIEGDKKEYDELIAQQDKFAKDAENYYKNTFSSAADKLFAYQDTLKKEGDKVVGTRKQIAKYRKLAAEYDRTYNEYTRLNALQDEPMNKASELLSAFQDDYKRRQAVWIPYLNELNRVYKEIYDMYQDLIDEAYTKYQNTIGVQNKDGVYEYVNGGDYTDPSGKTYAGLGTLTKSVQDEIDEIDLLMKENSDILGSFDPRYMPEKLSQYLVNSEYKGKIINWSPKNKGDDSRSGSDQGYGSGYSINDPIIGSGDRDRRRRRFGESTLFERLKQKQFFNPNDIKPVFPENPPPQLDPKTGMHPEYGKVAKRYRKLDPISANAMPPTGDPETDAMVDKQRTKPKSKLFGKLKKHTRKGLTDK